MKTFEEQATDIELEKSNPITRHDIKDSPFVIVGNEKGWVGTMGKYRITEPYDNKEDCEEELKEITWNRIVQIIIIINELNLKQDEQ